MATNTPLQSILLTSSTSNVTFSNIDQKYTDLVLVASTRSLVNGTNDALFITINGDSSALYSRTEMYNSGGGRASSETAFKYHGKTAGATSNAGTFGTSTINFMNYSNSTTFKTLIARCGMADSTYSEIKMSVGLYRSTNAITNMSITSESGTSFVAGSTFEIYGIKSGAQKAFGGDTVTTDGNYWYHTFKTSGTFLLQQPTSVDYLVVAGGGGGSGMWYYELGGGGAGGLRSTVTATGGGGSLESALSMSPGSYTVTVGAGGAGAPGPLGGTVAQHTGTVGSNSVFSTITSTGGGGGAGSDGTPSTGGSGGGGGGTGASGTANQGFAGGNSASGGGYSTGGGGGGAGAVGGNGSNPNAGNGGNGVATSISGSSVTYGGGGGGGTYDSANVGTGGTGGGGNANNAAAGSAGTANTGGGGGAGVRNGGTQYVGGAGGSGLVIVRYAV